MERSRQWAVRILHEAQLHDESCFVTLTYRDAPFSLEYRDFQLFLKRLRKEFSPRTIRFFMCGEYGGRFGRPHFHACLFGVSFRDRVFHSVSPSGERLYRSPILESLWTLGFSSVGELTSRSAAYVARYCTKKVAGQASARLRVDSSTGEIQVPEFNRMSLRPGIADGWIRKFASDVYAQDCVVIDGRKQRPPKFYSKHLAEVYPKRFADIEFSRWEKAQAGRKDGTPERLAVREQCARARLALKKRELE
ncbi:MAG: replication initiator protein [Microviridae sp.]|nr:MAG: replication initiator protein [Microviridae sp.]